MNNIVAMVTVSDSSHSIVYFDIADRPCICTLITIIIIINPQFLTRRNVRHKHPLKGRELSIYREIIIVMRGTGHV